MSHPAVKLPNALEKLSSLIADSNEIRVSLGTETLQPDIYGYGSRERMVHKVNEDALHTLLEIKRLLDFLAVRSEKEIIQMANKSETSVLEILQSAREKLFQWLKEAAEAIVQNARELETLPRGVHREALKLFHFLACKSLEEVSMNLREDVAALLGKYSPKAVAETRRDHSARQSSGSETQTPDLLVQTAA